MASRAASAQVPSTVESLGLFDLLRTVRRYLARAMMSESDRRLFEAFRLVAQEVGEPLLASRDAADFSDRLADAIERPELSMLVARTLSDLPMERTSLDPPDPSRPTWPRDVFSGAVARLEAAERLMLELVKARRQFVASVPEPARDLMQEHTRALAERPLWFLEDPTLHPRIKEMMLASARADTCMLAILHAVIAGERLEPWLSLVLADTLYYGWYQLLRLMASLPGVSVPADAVPQADRLNLALLDEETKATHAWLREFAMGASTDEASSRGPASIALGSRTEANRKVVSA